MEIIQKIIKLVLLGLIVSAIMESKISIVIGEKIFPSNPIGGFILLIGSLGLGYFYYWKYDATKQLEDWKKRDEEKIRKTHRKEEGF